MSELLDRLRAINPARTPNAALHEALRALDARNQEIVAAMLRGLDEQEELAREYERLTAALLVRQGQPLPVDLSQEPNVETTLLGDGWNN